MYRKRRKRLPSGSNGLPAWGIGLAIVSGILSTLFLIPLLSPPESLIHSILTKAGYSNRTALMWVAVAKLESGNFTNYIYRKGNNMFSMMFVDGRRPNHQDGHIEIPEGTFATYRTKARAVKDLIDYMKLFKYPKDFETPNDLIDFMASKNYFGKSSKGAYLNGVLSYYGN